MGKSYVSKQADKKLTANSITNIFSREKLDLLPWNLCISTLAPESTMYSLGTEIQTTKKTHNGHQSQQDYPVEDINIPTQSVPGPKWNKHCPDQRMLRSENQARNKHSQEQ